MINKLFKYTRVLIVFFPIWVTASEDNYENRLMKNGELVELNNFQYELAQAKKFKRPIMVEFSTAWCEFCETLEEEVIKPVVKNNIYENKIIIRKLEVNNDDIINAAGQQQSRADFAMHHDINFYPTVMFFNEEGKEISRRIVGLPLLDYVGGQLDNAVAIAIKQISNN